MRLMRKKKVLQILLMKIIFKMLGVEGLTREVEAAAPAKVARAEVHQKETRGLKLRARGKKKATGVGQEAGGIAVRLVEAEAGVKSVMSVMTSRQKSGAMK